MKKNELKKVAIVHDFFFQFGGAEKVIETLYEVYPNADLYTSFIVQEKFTTSPILTSVFNKNKTFTSLLNKVFNIKNSKGERLFIKFQKHFFFLYPILMRFLTVKNYDLVIISSTDCAKQISLKNNVKVVHYCNSPTRYLNGLVQEIDKKSLNIIFRTILPIFYIFLKPLDLNAVKRLAKEKTQWFANSNFIQRVIWEKYKTRSEVLYPPVDLNNFLSIERKPIENKSEKYYLSFGRISFHKRIDLAIAACLQLEKKLVIGGTSALESEIEYLHKIVTDWEAKTGKKNEFITFLGRISDQEYKIHLTKAEAFLFPGKEDFGITPVECLAAGLPVIAYKEGGALEYVKDGLNGVFFDNQNVDDLVEAILKFENLTFKTDLIKDSSRKFSVESFKDVISSL